MFVLGDLGCRSRERPNYKDLKIIDLAHSELNSNDQHKSSKSIYITVSIFAIPQENLTKLDKLKENLYSVPIKPNNPRAFRANSISAAYGRYQNLQETIELLTKLQAERINNLFLILSDSGSDNIGVSSFSATQNIYYTTDTGTARIAAVKPGQLVLQITAEKTRSTHGICNLDVAPVALPGFSFQLPNPKAIRQSKKVIFDVAAFNTKLGIGDFILLSPKKEPASPVTLNGLLFSRNNLPSKFIAYIILCRGFSG